MAREGFAVKGLADILLRIGGEMCGGSTTLVRRDYLILLARRRPSLVAFVRFVTISKHQPLKR